MNIRINTTAAYLPGLGAIRRSASLLLVSGCLALGACGDDSEADLSDASTIKADGGSASDASLVSNIDASSSANIDAGHDGATLPGDTLQDAGNGARLNIVAVSPTGHDRFYGVAYDAADE